MKLKIHTLFEYLLETTSAAPEAVLGFSLATPPTLGEFMADLDPTMSLDWSNQSFQGMDALREHVIGRAGLEGVCTADAVLITAGAAEANFLALTTLLRPGDELIAETPGWPQPFVLAEGLGVSVKPLPRREADEWRFDMAELESLITARTRLIFLCNPNNPTGQVMVEAELRQVCALAERVGAYVLTDEVYAGLEWEGGRVPAVAGMYARGISTGSVSKGLGLQGLRTGWLICRDRDLIFDAVVQRENSSEIMNVMGEAIAEIALRPQRYAAAIAKAKAEGAANLALLDEFITQREGLGWVRPPAGLIGLCHLPHGLDSDTVARRLLQPPYRTFLIPGSAYGCPHHIRLGVGGGAAVQLNVGLARLGQFLDDWRGDK